MVAIGFEAWSGDRSDRSAKIAASPGVKAEHEADKDNPGCPERQSATPTLSVLMPDHCSGEAGGERDHAVAYDCSGRGPSQGLISSRPTARPRGSPSARVRRFFRGQGLRFQQLECPSRGGAIRFEEMHGAGDHPT
jgi:hypothetical protein